MVMWTTGRIIPCTRVSLHTFLRIDFLNDLCTDLGSARETGFIQRGQGLEGVSVIHEDQREGKGAMNMEVRGPARKISWKLGNVMGYSINKDTAADPTASHALWFKFPNDCLRPAFLNLGNFHPYGLQFPEFDWGMLGVDVHPSSKGIRLKNTALDTSMTLLS